MPPPLTKPSPDDLFQRETEGGFAARHRALQLPAALVGPATSAEFNTVRESLSPVACLRLNDIRFEFDSSFVSPQIVAETKLLAGIRRDYPGLLASIFGHADPIGDDSYNKRLSGRRAAAVYALLTRREDIWEDIFQQGGVFTSPLDGDEWGARALQIMLGHLGHYDGERTGVLDQQTVRAVEAFQGSPAGAGLAPDGDPGPLTRRQLHRAYMDAVCLDEHDVSFQLGAEEFLGRGSDPQGKGDYQGCSEFNPVLLFSQAERAVLEAAADKSARNLANQPNRRVLLFFFSPHTRPSLDRWPCPRAKESSQTCRTRFYAAGDERRSFRALRREYKDTKDTFACRFYDRLAVESPCEVGPPLQVNTLRVFLKFAYLDPEPGAPPHDFPENFPVVVVGGDGTREKRRLGAGGRLSFEIPRAKRSFTLNFDFAETQYLACQPAAPGAEKERLVAESDLRAALDEGRRVFNLPPRPAGRAWEMGDFDWRVEGAATFRAGTFEDLEDARTAIGSEASPVVMTLDPHWQYLRFEYFDRVFGHTEHQDQRTGIPPMTLEGWRRYPPPGPPPPIDTVSNWTIYDHDQTRSCQCLPWVVRRKADRSIDDKPDANVLIRFRTVPGTFVESVDANTRRLVTLADAANPTDPLLNMGKSIDFDMNRPSAARLKYYDLPRVWKSRRYFTRTPDENHNFFEKLADRVRDSTHPDKLLTFCLDDIVLCRHDGDAVKPLTLKEGDRVAIFSHLFAEDESDPFVSANGLYNRDQKLPWFSQDVPSAPQLNYLSSYPNWTRLVIAGGNLFDIFDRRTPDADGQVVGARAAVRWVDA
ncbi:MAG TPA: peptidoglycan-binding protein, partial [Pyrinomonadaceae bacterium]|nr:peptidoglycan-binding protein [Pyrinomonadaceae bacterium]